MKRWNLVSGFLAYRIHQELGIEFSVTEWEPGSLSMHASAWDGQITIRNNECTAYIELGIGIHEIIHADIADIFPNPTIDDLESILLLIFRVCSNSSSAIYPKKGNRRTR